MKEQTRGSLPSIIRNDAGLYEGNLIAYFQAIFYNARNLHHPYHNFRHTFHVVWLCYAACQFYKDQLSPMQMRHLLIAAMFHDFDHSGMLGDDDLNIERALRGLKKHLSPEDQESYPQIAALIKMTQFPYVVASDAVDLSGWILRDADLSQAFSVAWLQQVVFGLAEEWHQKPIDILRKQNAFIGSLTYHTEWAQQEFEPLREGKISETNEILDLLELPPAAV